MKKYVLFLILVILVLVVGCQSCPKSCDDGDACTADGCSKYTNYSCVNLIKPCNDYNICTMDSCQPESGCSYQELNPCCANGICEDSEDYSSCPEDCEPTKGDCLKVEKENDDILLFENHLVECKDVQIIECREIKLKAKETMCLLNIAIDYQDGDICDYIDYSYAEILNDVYWYCSARFKYDKSACSYIDDNYWLQKCLEKT